MQDLRGQFQLLEEYCSIQMRQKECAQPKVEASFNICPQSGHMSDSCKACNAFFMLEDAFKLSGCIQWANEAAWLSSSLRASDFLFCFRLLFMLGWYDCFPTHSSLSMVDRSSFRCGKLARARFETVTFSLGWFIHGFHVGLAFHPISFFGFQQENRMSSHDVSWEGHNNNKCCKRCWWKQQETSRKEYSRLEIFWLLGLF